MNTPENPPAKQFWKHKFPSTKRKLREFFAAIPARFWCVDERNDDNGHFCALGHLDSIVERGICVDGKVEAMGVDPSRLAEVNNGGYLWNRTGKEDLSGRAIKRRVLRFMDSMLATRQ